LLKTVKTPLLVIAILFCIVSVGLFLFVTNSSNPLSNLDNYKGKANVPETTGQDREPEQSEKEEESLSDDAGFYANLEKEMVNDRHREVALKYKSRFARLQSEYQGKLNNLLASAKADLKENDSKASLVKLAYNYLKKGQAMEKECDNRFYTILNEMKQELRQENLPMDLAREAEREYKSQKSQRRGHLLSVAKEYIN